MRSLIETSRMRLQCFEPADLAELHAIFSDPRTHTIGSGPFTTVEQTAGWIDRRMLVMHTSGLAGEAAHAVLAECFAAGVRRVWATVRPANAASLRIAADLGMTLRHRRADDRGELLYLAADACGSACGQPCG
ncbi:GNAT family N-acetyltransferase [Kutzneria sp. NPDC051319]|uniref:GNAT family N-acetyltransferase n=1 Tax=Kutzneria sp. NPDC051319 TaxID=3155047 RepID=UPI0034163E9C